VKCPAVPLPVPLKTPLTPAPDALRFSPETPKLAPEVAYE